MCRLAQGNNKIKIDLIVFCVYHPDKKERSKIMMVYVENMKKIFEETKQLETPKAKYGDVLHRIGHLLYVFENKLKTQVAKKPKEEPKKTQPTNTPVKPEKSETVVKKPTETQKPEIKEQPKLNTPQETQNKATETQKGSQPTQTTPQQK